MAPPSSIAILGGGLTGLTAAYRLSTLLPSADITVLEGSSRLGGWIGSEVHRVPVRDDKGKQVEREIVIETGPRSIRPRGSRGAASTLKLLQDLDLRDSILPIPKSHPSARNRYLLDTQTNTLTALPNSLASVLRSQPPALKGLVRSAALEPFARRPQDLPSDESVDAFLSRRFGEPIPSLASAMVHGIYAAASSSLSVRSAFPQLWEAERRAGSVVLGSLLTSPKSEEESAQWAALGPLDKERQGWSLYGLRGGLSTLIDRLGDALRDRGVQVRTNTVVTEVSIGHSTPRIRIRTIRTNGSREAEPVDHLISALPPSRLATILSHPPPQLTANPSTSVGVVNLVYPLPPAQVHPIGFGYLIPRSSDWKTSNPESVLGVVFDSTALPGVDDSDSLAMTKLTVMMGGPYWSTYPGAMPMPEKEELVRLARRHVSRVFPHLEGVEPMLQQGNLWRDCIPTYLPGHGERMKTLHAAVAREYGGRLTLAGNGYGGVGLNDCVWSAEVAASGVASGEGITGLERWAEWE